MRWARLPFFSPPTDFARFAASAGGAVVCALWLTACSPKAAEGPAPTAAASAGAEENRSGAGDGIVLVREKRHDFPDKFAATIREIQSRCFEAKAVIAKAQGWAFDPAAERLTDLEIAALDTERTEEYFSGKRYAKIITGMHYSPAEMEPTREGTCKPVPQPFKSAEVRDDGSCAAMLVEYDLANKTGKRDRLKGDCRSAPEVPVQAGDPVAVPGTTAQCRWTAPPGGNAALARLAVPECTLVPSPVHAGTGRPLVAIRKMPEFLRQSTKALPGTQVIDPQSLVSTEQAVEVGVGVRVPAEKFDWPTDSVGFPLGE
jgi:hypothetical protein